MRRYNLTNVLQRPMLSVRSYKTRIDDFRPSIELVIRTHFFEWGSEP